MLALLRGLKQPAPGGLPMMYSTAATATSDWRANGLDLEGIARAGDLDIFVDQTWAGAWGEVGVRRQTFWNAPILGWSYQLGYLRQVHGIGSSFNTPPPQRGNRTTGADVIYGFADSIGLSRRRSIGVDVVFWDPPTITDYWYRPIRDNLHADPAPYALAAATLTEQRASRDGPRLAKTELAQTAAVAAWTVRGDGRRVDSG